MRSVNAKILEDILVCAVEGGINYWASIELYTRDRVVLVDDMDGKEYEVTPEVVARGFSLLGHGKGYAKNREAPAWFVKYWGRMYADALADVFDFDITDADVIVQAALFNEIVYG